MRQYKAKITFTIDENHPDRKYVECWKENKVFTFEDTYNFNEDIRCTRLVSCR